MGTSVTRVLCCVALAAVPAIAFAARNNSAPTGPSGCEPEEVRTRLNEPDSAEVSKACGVISRPWAYRGPRARHRALRSYGRRPAAGVWASRVAGLLLRDAVVDTAYLVPPIEIDCDTAETVPIFLLREFRKEASTFIVMRFDLGIALLFAGEQPLGMISFEARGDSLWSAMAEVLVDDPLLKQPRPTSHFERPAARPTPPNIQLEPGDELPIPQERVAPVYPDDARVQGISGTVLCQALVGTNGRILDARVVDGPALLRDAAIEAVWQWRFTPALSNGQPVAVWVGIPVKFSLR